MRHSLLPLIAGLVLLTGCQAPAAAPAASRTGAASHRSAGSPVAPTREAEPLAAGAALPSPTNALTNVAASTWASRPRLMRALRGRIRIDASYIIAAGAGNIIAAGAGNIIAAGAGNVIAAGAGNVIAAGAGNVIAAGAGNAVASHKYRAAAADAPSVPAGTQLPVRGMLVQAVSLLDGQPLGDPVYTDDAGYYTLNLPDGLDEANVLITAVVPGHTDDPRLQYAVFASAQGGDANTIDEDAAVVTHYYEQAFEGKFSRALDPNGPTSQVIAILRPALAPIAAAVGDPKAAQALVPGLAHIMLAELRVDEMMIPGTQQLVSDYFLALIRRADMAAVAKMKDDPTFFAKQIPTSDIRRPSDFSQYVVSQYLVGDDKDFLRMMPEINALNTSFLLTKDDLAGIEQAATTIAGGLAGELKPIPAGTAPDLKTSQGRINAAIQNLIATAKKQAAAKTP